MTEPTGRRRRVLALLAGLALSAAVAGCGSDGGGDEVKPASASSSAAASAPPYAVPADRTDPNPLDADVADPTAVSVPKIGVQSSLIDLDVDASGVLEVPSSYDIVGWYVGGPAPGAIGPAVLVGHVDSKAGPGVFYQLHTLVAGDAVTVSRSDGSTVEFRVSGVQSFPKDAFPTQAVYGPTPDPQLRLITCGGSFDVATGNYESNVVVSAVLAPSA